jgi:DNA-binding response OmpR family regulator
MATQKTKVLVVEDAPEFRQMIEAIFEREGVYSVVSCSDGAVAIERAREIDPDVIVLDVGLPGMDGVSVCRELRAFTDAYVIMLTARDEEVDRLIGLAVGADDYMTKPFSARELIARVQTVLRRPRAGVVPSEAESADDTIELGDVRLDRLAREVTVGGELVELTKIEFDLLETLISRPNMVFSRQLLLETVWGDDWYGDDHMISVHVANVRKKLDRSGVKHIKTVRGVGYRYATSADA